MQKIIRLSETQYIVVDDSEIKISDWAFDILRKKVLKCFDVHKKDRLENDYLAFEGNIGNPRDTYKKITHSTQPLEFVKCGLYLNKTGKLLAYDKIEPLSLSEVEEAIYGYSVEKMAENYYNTLGALGTEYDKTTSINLIIWGFKAHQELTDAKYKEVIELLTNITEWSSFKDHPIGKQAQRALDLLPKTEWDIEIDEQGKIKLI